MKNKIEDILKSFKVYKENTNVLAKTDGISLLQHTFDVYEEYTKIINEKNFVIDKYSEISKINKDDIFTYFLLVISLHDIGKSHCRWQDCCANNKLISVGLRHEFIFSYKILKLLRLKYKISEEEILPIFISILAHHRNLNLNKLNKISNTMCYIDTEEEIIEINNKKGTLLNVIKNKFFFVFDDKIWYNKIWYKNSIFRHYLQLSDKRASILESNKDYLLPEIQNFKYNFNSNWIKRNLQILAEDNWQKDILILRSPTGMGKTSAALLWSKKQIENSKADRIVFTMPTQFTSNALTGTIKNDIESSISVQHSNSKFLDNSDSIYYNWHKTIESTVNVCTIDHILNSMCLTTEEQHSILFNLTNSCLIIDEADFYDNFVIANIIELLKFCLSYKIPVLIMSATFPNSFANLLNEKLNRTDVDIIDDISDNNRIRTDIKMIENESSEYSQFLINKICVSENCIVYCNTIQRAINFYNKIIEKRKDVVLYHSKLIETDKRIKEEQILNMLGQKSWENGAAKGIIIMTQIGELSINISTSLMISDICPIDRLVQRFGRGRRFDKNICEVYLIKPIKDDLLYPAPYGYYNLYEKKWITNKFLLNTIKLLKTGQYNFKNYIEIINQIYLKYKIDFDSIENSRLLNITFNNNVIVNPEYESNEDNTISTSRWKSRNIDAQMRIIVGEPKNIYYKYYDFDFYKLNNSINIPYYEYENLLKHGYILNKEIIISDNKKLIQYIDKKHYNSNFGLNIEIKKSKKL